MQELIDARNVVRFIKSLSDFTIQPPRASYSSIGAVLIDAVLQAGLNYKTVVAPRVLYFLENYPNIETSSTFYECLINNGIESVCQWSHKEKQTRLLDLTVLLIQENIETIEQLHNWIKHETSQKLLLSLSGVGMKTVDYLSMLVGIPSIPVDRHLRSFISVAGVELTEYIEYRRVAELTADLIEVPRELFDYSVWMYVSSGKLDQPSLL